MQNLPAVQTAKPATGPLADLPEYVKDAPDLPATRLKTWNLIGRGKAKLDELLKRAELELSGLLTGYDKMKLEDLSKAIAAYKLKHAAMVETRKGFTKFLNGAIETCMTTEKRLTFVAKDAPTDSEIIKAIALELKLREDAEVKAKAAKAKALEIANFILHFENDNINIATDFRVRALSIINTAYTSALTAKVPVDSIDEIIELARKSINELAFKEGTVFDRKLLTKEEATELFAKILPLSKSDIRKEMRGKLDAKFSMYANDLPVADEAIEASNEEAKEGASAVVNEADNEKAINTVSTSAQSYVSSGGGTVKGVIRSTKIVVKDLTDTEMIAIITAFLSNGPRCIPFLTVTDRKNLKVEQMAAALDKAAIKVSDVRYEETKK